MEAATAVIAEGIKRWSKRFRFVKHQGFLMLRKRQIYFMEDRQVIALTQCFDC